MSITYKICLLIWCGIIFFICFWLCLSCPTPCGILAPDQRSNLCPLHLRQSLNHWTTGEVPGIAFLWRKGTLWLYNFIVVMTMDREAWRAAIHGVAKSWTQLSNWSDLIWMTKYIFNLVDINSKLSVLKKKKNICICVCV